MGGVSSLPGEEGGVGNGVGMGVAKSTSLSNDPKLYSSCTAELSSSPCSCKVSFEEPCELVSSCCERLAYSIVKSIVNNVSVYMCLYMYIIYIRPKIVNSLHIRVYKNMMALMICH